MYFVHKILPRFLKPSYKISLPQRLELNASEISVPSMKWYLNQFQTGSKSLKVFLLPPLEMKNWTWTKSKFGMIWVRKENTVSIFQRKDYSDTISCLWANEGQCHSWKAFLRKTLFSYETKPKKVPWNSPFHISSPFQQVWRICYCTRAALGSGRETVDWRMGPSGGTLDSISSPSGTASETESDSNKRNQQAKLIELDPFTGFSNNPDHKPWKANWNKQIAVEQFFHHLRAARHCRESEVGGRKPSWFGLNKGAILRESASILFIEWLCRRRSLLPRIKL